MLLAAGADVNARITDVKSLTARMGRGSSLPQRGGQSALFGAVQWGWPRVGPVSDRSRREGGHRGRPRRVTARRGFGAGRQRRQSTSPEVARYSRRRSPSKDVTARSECARTRTRSSDTLALSDTSLAQNRDHPRVRRHRRRLHARPSAPGTPLAEARAYGVLPERGLWDLRPICRHPRTFFKLRCRIRQSDGSEMVRTRL
jgi:hypothetical protein